MPRIYYVTFEKRLNCTIYNYIFHCYANNANEAKEICRKAWADLHPQKKSFRPEKIPHQFSMYAHRSGINNPELLKVINWKGQEVKGQSVIGAFIMPDFHAWRVNGRNLYGVSARR